MISSLERRKKIARRLREWFPGATYHLMERGVRRQEIFQDEFDYQVFTELLKTAAEDNGCMIHAYCFMTNHFHLLVETGDMEIGKFMKQIACKYAMYYNHRYGYKGHVFEGRYKSCLVQTDEYFLQTSRYIHLNPVKAGMVFRPEAYRWSSYRGMVNMQDDGITFHAKTLAYFKNGGIYGYRISGILENGHSLIRSRPFRAPHHDASLNALIGGGVNVMPGEVSLAHNGVLFLDELAEFSRRTLDALRQPIEDKRVCISRVNGTHTFPSNFMFVTAMNPCPCGYYPSSKCRCTDYEIIKYRGKISGPIMDRIDIQKEVKPVNFFNLKDESSAMTSEEIRIKVERARIIQQKRYKNKKGMNCNSQMSTSDIQKYCELDAESLKLLRETSERYGYSARVIHKLLRLARTSADLDGNENIRFRRCKKGFIMQGIR